MYCDVRWLWELKFSLAWNKYECRHKLISAQFGKVIRIVAMNFRTPWWKPRTSLQHFLYITLILHLTYEPLVLNPVGYSLIYVSQKLQFGRTPILSGRTNNKPQFHLGRTKCLVVSSLRRTIRGGHRTSSRRNWACSHRLVKNRRNLRRLTNIALLCEPRHLLKQKSLTHMHANLAMCKVIWKASNDLLQQSNCLALIFEVKFRPHLKLSILELIIDVANLIRGCDKKTHNKFAVSVTRVKNIDYFCQQRRIQVKNKFKRKA
jgi:hypothetical protein